MNIYILGLGKRVKELHDTAEYIKKALEDRKIDANVTYEKRTRQPLENRILHHYAEIDNADIVIAMRDYYTKHPFDTRLLCEIAYAKHKEKTVLYSDFDEKDSLVAAILKEHKDKEERDAEYQKMLYKLAVGSVCGGGGSGPYPSKGDDTKDIKYIKSFCDGGYTYNVNEDAYKHALNAMYGYKPLKGTEEKGNDSE